MSEHEVEHYFAVRRTKTRPDQTTRIMWLCATVNYTVLRNKFYECPSYYKPDWSDDDDATWFRTYGDAKKRLRCKTVKEDKDNASVRWDIVEVKLIAHTKVVHTSAEDAITKLAVLAEGAA